MTVSTSSTRKGRETVSYTHLVGVTGFTPSVLRAAGAVWLSALGVWVYGPPDALTSLRCV